MIKVIYFTDTFYSAHGGRTHAREFYKALLLDHRVSEVVVLPKEHSSPVNTDRKINLFFFLRKTAKIIIPSGVKRMFRLKFPKRQTYKELIGAIAQQGTDVLIMRHGLHFRYINRLVKDFPKLRIVVEFNSSLFAETCSNISFISYWRRQESKSLQKAHRISAVSGFLKEYLISNDGMVEERILVNPNGVDIASFESSSPELIKSKRDELGIPHDAIVFGYVGGMEKFRRLPEVVERFALLLEKGYEKMFLVLVGNGEDLREIGKIKDKYKATLEGHFYCNENWVSYEEIPAWMHSFDIGLFPFTAPYCSPLKIFEYAACGLPILGPKVPAIAENAGAELCSVLIDQDGSNFEESLVELHDNIAKYKLKSFDLRNVIQAYSWTANVDKIISSIKN
jgi:glycosyltransferase involved in cell wall biosynthesis